VPVDGRSLASLPGAMLPRTNCLVFCGMGVVLPSGALEGMTKGRLMPAQAAAAPDGEMDGV
jgi:hypothetical protein